MFTLRLIGTEKTTVVSAARYDVIGSLNGSFVITYPQTTSDVGGVEFHIGDGHRQEFNACYVENQSGKTIDRIG